MCNESVGAQTSSCDELPAGPLLFQVGLSLWNLSAALEGECLTVSASKPLDCVVKRLQNPWWFVKRSVCEWASGACETLISCKTFGCVTVLQQMR